MHVEIVFDAHFSSCYSSIFNVCRVEFGKVQREVKECFLIYNLLFFSLATCNNPRDFRFFSFSPLTIILFLNFYKFG